MHESAAALLENSAANEPAPGRHDELMRRAETERLFTRAARDRAAAAAARLTAEGVEVGE